MSTNHPPLRLRSPDHVLLGAVDVDAHVSFWNAMGFVETFRGIVPTPLAEAYGLPVGAIEVGLGVSGASTGGLRIVQTPHAPEPMGPWDRGPYAVDLYTRDMDRSIDAAIAAGASHRGRMVYEFGTMRLEEGKTTGPDGVRLVFISNSTPRPSVLDTDPARLHSEVHSIVNVVESVDTFSAAWHGVAGLTVLGDATIASPGLADLMELPKIVSARMGLYCDVEVTPIRYEALEFIGLDASDTGVLVPQWPLRAGQPLAVFTIDAASLDTMCLTLRTGGFTLDDAVSFDAVSFHDGSSGASTRACLGVDPSGIRFELRTR
jgi:hypothetical protein